MAERKRRSRRRPASELFPEFTEAKNHLLKAEKEVLLAVRSLLDRAIEKAEDANKERKRKYIRKVQIK
jgi:hypothetical protein